MEASMDPTQTIIRTSLINIITSGRVGGIVNYTLQTQIDATIQKALFEHQTKFTINHAKAVETLENLYQKFVAFSNAMNESISLRRHSILEDNQWSEKIEQAKI